MKIVGLLGVLVCAFVCAGCGGGALDTETGTFFNAHVDNVAPDYAASTFAIRVKPFDSNVYIGQAYFFDQGSNQQKYLSLSQVSNPNYLVNGTMIVLATYQGQKLHEGVTYYLLITVTDPDSGDQGQELWYVKGLSSGRAQSPY